MIFYWNQAAAAVNKKTHYLSLVGRIILQLIFVFAVKSAGLHSPHFLLYLQGIAEVTAWTNSAERMDLKFEFQL